MFQLKSLLAVCLLALAVGSANASTFNVTGFFSGTTTVGLTGTIDVNVATGTITAPDLNVTGLSETFVSVFALVPPSPPSITDWDLAVATISGIKGDGLFIHFAPSFDATHTTGLTGFAGATISIWDVGPLGTVFCDGSCPAPIGEGGTISPTPLPAALPLFATRLGALGLLGWRRKRNAAAVAA